MVIGKNVQEETKTKLFKIGDFKNKLKFCFYKCAKKNCSKEDFRWMTDYLVSEEIKTKTHIEVNHE